MKINVIIDSVLDGVLFFDEVYVLVVIGVKNDFGLVVIDILLVRMENDCDWLVVIIVGYCVDLDKFLDINEGFWLCFICNIDFFFYMFYELVEIVYKMVE